ncbi:MAG: hypothetical protein IPJ27_16570 [Candidatus Accumulibacter sp.]|uniref:Uncharacterized protein n=1 Tax=Candidatus Accumulibacter proximus TaxID=2954385 RepID=A0A935Q1W0_9PROT|nr:hypothetical protein [Candidatus Accumulibacter proximus]
MNLSDEMPTKLNIELHQDARDAVLKALWIRQVQLCFAVPHVGDDRDAP